VILAWAPGKSTDDLDEDGDGYAALADGGAEAWNGGRCRGAKAGQSELLGRSYRLWSIAS
jgi:hypothetical protein